MTPAELREKVATAIAVQIRIGKVSDQHLADAAIRVVVEACAEIAAGYDWLGERRAAGIGKIGSGYDEDTFAAGADHAAREIAARILRDLLADKEPKR